MGYPPEKITDLLDGKGRRKIKVGSRSIWKNRRDGGVKALRVLLSRTYCMLVEKLFGATLKDYQSGFKAFRRGVIAAIQPLASNGFEIDTEILIKAQRKGFKIGFVPVTYTYKGDSKVNIFLDSTRMLFSLLRWNVNGELAHSDSRV